MYKDFSSLPPAEEQTFVVFEQHSSEAAKKARTLAFIVGGVMFVLVMVIVFSHKAPESRFDEEQAAPAKSLGAEEEKPAAKPAAAEEAKPAEGEGAEGAAAEGAAAEGAAAEGAAAEGEGAEGAAEGEAKPEGE